MHVGVVGGSLLPFEEVSQRLLVAGRDELPEGLGVLAAPDRKHLGLTKREFRSVTREHAAHVDNWHFWGRVVGAHGGYRRAFLHWLEPDATLLDRYDALAASVTWTRGKLAVTIERVDGTNCATSTTGAATAPTRGVDRPG